MNMNSDSNLRLLLKPVRRRSTNEVFNFKENPSKNTPVKKVNKEEKQKVNKTRTQLLLFIDEEHNKYLKSCTIKLNDELPKEIVKKFSESFTVKFDNPIIHSSSNRSHSSVVQQKSNKETDKCICSSTESSASPNNDTKSENKYKSYSKQKEQSAGIFYFSKCIKEIGKEFIDYRKINVSSKKFEKDTLIPFCRYKIPCKTKLDTQLSFIETVTHITSQNKSLLKPSKRLSSTQFRNALKPRARKEIDLDQFLDKTERDARNIQDNFNKLQGMVDNLKKMGNEALLFNRRNSCFNKNIRDYFDEELFDMLEFKGLKLDYKKNNFNNSFDGKNEADNYFNDDDNDYFKKIYSESKFKIKDQKVQSTATATSDNKHFFIDIEKINLDVCLNRNSNSNASDKRETKENTRSPSPLKIRKLQNDVEEEIELNFDAYKNIPTCNNSANNVLENISEVGLISKIFHTPVTRSSCYEEYETNQNGTLILKLIQCNGESFNNFNNFSNCNKKYDSDISGSEISKYSAMSKYKSDYTISNMSEQSE